MRHTVENDWTTKAGLRAICILTGMGHRCGYVGIPKGHPLYGAEYHEHSDALREAMERIRNDPIGKRGVVPLFCHKSGECPPDVVFDVHGGITYSGGGDGYPVDGDEWWFGFDCAHAGDATGSSLFPGGVLRTQEYVESECESLAEQLAMTRRVEGDGGVMKYTKEQYEEFDVSEGDDIDIRCRTTKLVKTKKPHKCCMDRDAHVIPAGTMAVRDSAIVDGKWSTVYSCTDCIDKWYDECEMYEPQTATPDLTGGEG